MIGEQGASSTTAIWSRGKNKTLNSSRQGGGKNKKGATS